MSRSSFDCCLRCPPSSSSFRIIRICPSDVAVTSCVATRDVDPIAQQLVEHPRLEDVLRQCRKAA
jgi:hypothetical protein